MKINPTLITKATSLFTIAVACLVLAGWGFNIPGLTTLLLGAIPIKVNLAICFLLIGIALYILNADSLNQPKKKLALFCASLVLMIGLLTLSQYIVGWNLGIDELLWKTNPGAAPASFPGRMSMFASIFTSLWGIILLLLGNRKYHQLIQSVVLLFIPVASLVIVYDFSGIKTFSQPHTTSLPAVITILILSVGILYSFPLSYLKVSFQRKIAGFFVLISLVLVFLFFVLNKNRVHVVDTGNWVEHTNKVLFKSQEILTRSQDIVAGTRGYVITGKEEYLAPFIAAAATIEYSVRELNMLTKDNPGQQERVVSLQKLVTENIRLRTLVIKTRKEAGLEAAVKIIKTGEGKRISDQIRSVIASILQEENQLLVKRNVENEQRIQNSSGAIALFQFITVLMLLAVFILIYNNIRQRNKAEKLLKEFKHFFNNSNDFSCIANLQGYFEILNPNFEKALGYSKKELLENQFLYFIHPDDVAGTIYEIEKLKDGALTINFMNRYRKKNGDYLWFDWNATPDPVTGKLYAIARDTTERKKAEEALQNTLKEVSDYKFALDESAIVAITDQKGIIQQVNDNFCKISKYKREELIGQDHRIINSGYHPKEFIHDLWVTIANGKVWRGELKNKAKDGTIYWVDTTIVPFMNEQGNPYQYVAIRSDITEQKILEDKLKQFNRGLEQKVKERTEELSKKAEELKISNNELERFAYIASHDLQEPLRMVSSFLNLLEEMLDGQLNDTAKKYIHFALDGAGRMKILINDLLQYSRIGSKKEDFTATDLNEVMEYVTHLLENNVKEKKAIITIGLLPVIMADKTLISRLLINLVGNALKYSDGKAPEIEIGYTSEPGNDIFYVKDNGIGIETKYFDKIFVIFQRLHNSNKYSGTGIGLAICKKIVEIHKGKIWVEAEEGKGSTFYFSIPKNNI